MLQSQALQDLFVITVLKQKRDGVFVEIGSNHPVTHNNTYLLESAYNWRGLMIEYDRGFEAMYKQLRPNSIYRIQDARTVPYRDILDTNGYPREIDYLQIDLDVDNKSTIDTLQLLDATVFDKYTFASVTFEHDIYRGDFYNTRGLSREIFARRGYELVFPDVAVFWQGKNQPFEDWYVHPSLVDMKFVNKLRSNNRLTPDELKRQLSLTSND
jgi:hypothetical protein